MYTYVHFLPRRNSGRGGGTGHLGNLHKLRMPEILAQVQLEDPPEEQVLPWNRDQKFKPVVIPRPEQVRKGGFFYFETKSIDYVDVHWRNVAVFVGENEYCTSRNAPGRRYRRPKFLCSIPHYDENQSKIIKNSRSTAGGISSDLFGTKGLRGGP